MKTLILCLIIALCMACEKRENPPGPESSAPKGDSLLLPALDEGGGFFDEDLLLEGALDLRDHLPECVGASSDELERPDHPAIIRGQVLAPAARLARPSFFPQWLVPSAHAAPLEGELPVANVRVALYRQEKGEPVGPTLIETRTNVVGAWCMRIPDGAEAGTGLILVATSIDSRLRLRRLFALPGDVDISSFSEAFVELLVEEEIDLEALPRATFLNMEVLASTAIDLLNPVVIEEGEGLAEAMTKIRKSLRQDPRFTAILARQETPSP